MKVTNADVKTENYNASNNQQSQNAAPTMAASSGKERIYTRNNNAQTGQNNKAYDTVKEKEDSSISSVWELISAHEEETEIQETEPEPEVEKNKETSSNTNIFAENVEYESKCYFENNGLRYLIVGPKDVGENEELPVLVNLHGTGEVGLQGESSIKQSAFVQALLQAYNTSESEDGTQKKFRGYIIYPVLPKGDWDKSEADNINNVINDFESLKSKCKQIPNNIHFDKDNLAIAGHSMGGNGAIKIASYLKDLFKKVAILSATKGDTSALQMPYDAYVSEIDHDDSSAFMHEAFNKDKLIEVKPDKSEMLQEGLIEEYEKYLNNELNNDISLKHYGHCSLPKDVYELDEDKNGLPDFFESLFLNN